MPASKKEAKEFVKRWKKRLSAIPAGSNNEQQDTQKFWVDLLINVLGIPSNTIDSFVDFERKVRGRRIDVFVSDHNSCASRSRGASTSTSPSLGTAAWRRRSSRPCGTRGTCRTPSAPAG